MKPNDLNEIANNDKSHVWHHLVQHKPWLSTGPMVMDGGKGMRVTDVNGSE